MQFYKPKAVLFDWAGTLARGYNIYKEVPSILEKLKMANIYMAVVSNNYGEDLRHELFSLGLDDYFGAIVGSSDVKNPKPYTDMVYKALEGSGIEPSKEVFFVGDSIGDMMCANDSGCVSVLLETRCMPDYMVNKVKIDVRLKNHVDLLNFIDNCISAI